eukprot:CAMPEP_0119311424 /NCGR_PEP_ID=MMETSP1333-20130426/22377_1 /TAXON_ID=418940 /ORGANISM="Scyphosphaera apsteinii, Strain RCC1455" /LENGTH=193 /DNA_ID=CAMNT_0007315789 /DNA_START=293 /DNA_END=874 /DNA_ORIENTATION=+
MADEEFDGGDLLEHIVGEKVSSFVMGKIGFALFAVGARRLAAQLDRRICPNIMHLTVVFLVQAYVHDRVALHFGLCEENASLAEDVGLIDLSRRIRQAWLDFHPPHLHVVRLTHSVSYLIPIMALTSSTSAESLDWALFEQILVMFNEVAHGTEDPVLGCARGLFEIREMCDSGSLLRTVQSYPTNWIFLNSY